MRRRGWEAITASPLDESDVIATWTPRLWVRSVILVTPAVMGPMLVWLAVTEPQEVLTGPWLLAWIGGVLFLGHATLLGFRARVVLREHGVVITGAVRHRLVSWDHLHGAVAHWGGLELRAYEPWGSDFDRYATSGVIVDDWRRPWRLRKRSQPVADRINGELARRGGRVPLGPTPGW